MRVAAGQVADQFVAQLAMPQQDLLNATLLEV